MKTKSLTLLAALSVFYINQIVAQPPGSNIITIAVTFNTTPVSASSAFADLKYNKLGVYNYEMDDRSPGMRDVFAFFNGGTAPVNGVTYPGKTFTDGCGNVVKWRAAVATNARLQSDNSDWANYNNCLNWAEMANLVNNNWMIENHGFYHNKTGTYANGENTSKNINDNTIYIKDRLLEQGVQYIPRIFVVPNNDAGYVPAAQALGYMAAVSQQSLDGYPIYPQYVDNTSSISDLPQTFAMYNRGFKDGWDAGSVGYYQGIIDNYFLSGMSAANKKIWRFAGHYFSDTDFARFISLMNYLETKSADRVWITTLQEFLEYRETKAAVVKTETLSGNTLTITLDISSLPAKNRFRDMSVLINSGATINTVTVTGADASSFNAATGLINVFEKQSESIVTLPVTLDKFTALRNNAAVDIKWTASVSGTANFAVERSTNGNDFSELSVVKSSSTSGAQSYTYKDVQPAEGNNPYRLKILEAGAAVRYSPVVVVRFSTLDKTMIYPNPVKGRMLTIDLSQPIKGVVDLWLTNTTGAVVHQQKIQVFNQRQLKINLPQSVPAGTYILEVSGGQGVKESVMIVCL